MRELSELWQPSHTRRTRASDRQRHPPRPSRLRHLAHCSSPLVMGIQPAYDQDRLLLIEATRAGVGGNTVGCQWYHLEAAVTLRMWMGEWTTGEWSRIWWSRRWSGSRQWVNPRVNLLRFRLRCCFCLACFRQYADLTPKKYALCQCLRSKTLDC